MRRWFGANRGAIFLLALLLAGGVLGQSVAERSGSTGHPSLTSTDTDPRGALALALWLERLGYHVDRVSHSADSIDQAGLIFILMPVRAFTRAEATSLLNWVRAGGTLVYLPNPIGFAAFAETESSDAMSELFALDTRFVSLTQTARASEALTRNPRATFEVETREALRLTGDAWVPLVQNDDAVFAATRTFGDGRVYTASTEAFFANDSIGKRDNAELLLEILDHTPDGKSLEFEEAHHRFVDSPDLMSVMRHTPWGWSVGYAALITFAFLVWAGRRFGPPVVPERAPPRSTGEYVSALAGLLQRARAADWLQAQYAALVRRRLARMMGVRSDLPSSELARLLAERRAVDRDAVAAGIAGLDGPTRGEGALLDLVRSLEDALRTERRP